MNARFAAGTVVRVAEPQVWGHVRTPHYVRGKRGVVERVCGAFANPEELAYGRRGGEPVPLYRVSFAQRDLWSEYTGSADDTVDVELFEHWLLAVDT